MTNNRVSSLVCQFTREDGVYGASETPCDLMLAVQAQQGSGRTACQLEQGCTSCDKCDNSEGAAPQIRELKVKRPALTQPRPLG